MLLLYETTANRSLDQPFDNLSVIMPGDVGCGKTVVAFLACLEVIASGFQAALMVPTELVAIQHYEHLSSLLENMKDYCRLSIVLLTGSTPSKQSKMILKASLRFTVIDEQHRFGVIQRGSFNRGFGNRIAVSGDTRVKPSAFVAGGFGNRIAVSGDTRVKPSAFVAGGFGNRITVSGFVYFSENFGSIPAYPPFGGKCRELGLPTTLQERYESTSGFPYHATRACIELTHLVVCLAPGSLLPCYKSAYRWFSGPPQTPKMGFWVIPLLVVSTAPGFLLPCYKSAYRWFAGPPQTPKMGNWVIPLLVVSTAPGFLLPCYKSAYRWFAGPPQTPKMGNWVIPLLVVSTAPGFLLPCYKSAYRWFAGSPQTPKMGNWVIPLLVVSTAPGFLLPCYKSAYRWFAGPPQTPKMGNWVILLLVVSTAPGFLLPCYKSVYRWFAGPPQTPKMGNWVIPLLVVSTAPGFLLPCYKSAYRWFAGSPQTPKMGNWVIPLLVVSTALGFLLPCYKSAYRWFAGPPQTPKMGNWVIPLLVVSTAPGFLLPCYKSAYRWFAGSPQTPKMGNWVIPLLVVSTAPGFLLPCYKSAYRWFAGPPQTPKMGIWIQRLYLSEVDGADVDVEVEDYPHHATRARIGLTCLVVPVALDSPPPCYKSAYRRSTSASSALRTGFGTYLSCVEMFSWRRSADLTPDEPSEAAIWEVIDRHDPRGDADIRDRLEQHGDMLRGRDTFCGFFSRSPLLSVLSPDSIEFDNPTEWVTSIRLQCGEYNPVDSTIDQISWGMCDVLQPAADILEPVGQSRLLGHRQLHSKTLGWPHDSTVGRMQSPAAGYTCWCRYVLRAHRYTLQEAGIYEAVYASLFDFGQIPPSWARGLVEFWDSGSNTCWVGPEELTVTLSDLQAVSGLPVVGGYFEECIPPDVELFRRVPSADGSRRGRLVLPDIYPALLQHYRQVYTSSDLSTRAGAAMPVDTWVRSFLLDSCLSTTAVSLHDPFEFGLRPGVLLSEDTAEPSSVGCRSPALPGIDEDLLLAGFLATWLCIFVLPLRVGSVRCSVLLAASQLSQGQRLSLAPPVLARIYRALCTASEATSLELRGLVLPWHYLYGWIHLHIRGAFSCLECPQYFLERGYPTVMQLAQASSTLELERVRLFFFAPHLVVDRFAVVHQPDVVGLPSYLSEQVIADGFDRQRRCVLLQSRGTLRVAEYFVSLRPGWLCHRSGNIVILEGYQPNRVARQFGFSQATAYDGRPLIPGVADTRHTDVVPQEARLYAASAVWLHLLRFGTGSTFRIAPPHSHTGVSYTHLTWVRLSFAPFLERGARTYERRVHTLGLPRGRRPSRGSLRIRDDRGNFFVNSLVNLYPVGWLFSLVSSLDFGAGRHSESHTATESTAPSPVRAQVTDPAPHRTEAPRFSRGRSGSRRTEPSPTYADPVASSVPEHFLTPEEASADPRLSDFSGYSAPDSSSYFSFQVDPYGSFWSGEAFGERPIWPGESSRAGAALPEEPPVVPPYTPTVLDLVPVAAAPYSEALPSGLSSSYPEVHPSDFASSSSVPAEADYVSEIRCHAPVASDPWHGDMYGHCTNFLHDLIARVDPGSPDSMGQFTSTANYTLGLLAQLGLETSEMQYWETLCRETEFYIKRLQSLSIMRTRVSLIELQEKVDGCRAAANVARDEFDRSTEALRRHRESSSSMASEIEGLTSRVRDLWRDIKGVMSRKSDLQEGHDRRERLIRREEQRNQMLHQALQAAETALTRATEELHTAETEYQVLAEVSSQLGDLRARLP
ncbi:hypothetical protein IEQ34_020159 [Dendrobium chrysotoxum]|uniref:Helicase ATP-binding domain-containing protein n=1 Tax=Dendrobium chrysotoxum TaxID=161865 RepID=A0AAV7G1C2_DENCH|nr:hypothetical protein IEQ34_020159 [Dendrobium chrysotoxum]